MLVVCKICGKTFSVPPRDVRRGRKYCSLSCRNKSDEWKLKKSLKPDLQPNENLAYILGVMLGDGCVCKYRRERRIQLSTKSKEFAISFAEALKKMGLHPYILFTKLRKRSYGWWFLKANSTVFYEWYRSLSIDDIYRLLETPSMKRAFIRGFYESEGCLRRRYGYWNGKRYICKTYELHMCNTNEKIIDLCLKVCGELGYDFSHHVYRYRKGLIHRLYLAGGQKEIERFLGEIKPSIKNDIPRPGSSALLYAKA
jgi:hypothetical protein